MSRRNLSIPYGRKRSLGKHFSWLHVHNTYYLYIFLMQYYHEHVFSTKKNKHTYFSNLLLGGWGWVRASFGGWGVLDGDQEPKENKQQNRKGGLTPILHFFLLLLSPTVLITYKGKVESNGLLRQRRDTGQRFHQCYCTIWLLLCGSSWRSYVVQRNRYVVQIDLWYNMK